jgi:hypothetical protein
MGEAIGFTVYTGRQWTNAQHVDELGGRSLSTGASVGGWSWFQGTGEFNFGPTYWGRSTVGGFGVGMNPLAPFGLIEVWTPIPNSQ